MGCDYVRADYSAREPHTILVACLMIVSLVGCLYTIATQERTMVLQCLCLMPLAVQGISKFFIFISGAPTIRGAVEMLVRVHRQCDRNDREARLLVRWSLILQRVIQAGIITMGTTAVVFCLVPLCIFASTGEWEPLLPIVLPLFDVRTLFGLIVQSAFQLQIVFITAIGVLAADLTFSMHILHMCPLTAVLEAKLLDLGNRLREAPGSAKRPACTEHLNNCIRMHMEYFEYLHRLSDFYYVIVLSEILIDGLSMCIFMFVMTQITWVPLYVFYMTFLVKTFLACVVGTVADMCTERITGAFNAFPWNLLAVIDQQKIVVLIQRVQLPTVLMCGTVKLNMELFVILMKQSFSVAMLLSRFAEEE